MREKGDATLAAGVAMRRSMFGDDLVDRNYENAPDFQRPIQDWIAGAVWADVWTRDALDPRTRSLATIAMLAALNRRDELEMHLTAAPGNGCTAQDVQEILLHVAPYCGAPAALSSFRLAEDVLTRVGALPGADRPPIDRGDHALRPE